MDKMKMETANKTLENLAKLKEMFPEVITESKDENGEIIAAVDAKKLEQLLSTKVIEGDECYDFTWVGKKQAMVEACKPIRKTLRPCREESVDWENTQNLYIEGDNLDVLKLLQESYLNKVKMIYIDPPYNTGNDFIYNDSFVMDKDDYEEGIGLKDENELIQFKVNNDSNPRFHSDWCSMMYSRLKLAQNILSPNGIIFISINDKEIDTLKKICVEIFGARNFIATLIWDKNVSAQAGIYKVYHEYILVFSKSIENMHSPYALNNDIFDAAAIKKVSGRHPATQFTFPKGTRFDAPDGTCIEKEYGDVIKVKVVKGRLIANNGKLDEDVTLEAGFTQANQMKEYFYGDKDNLFDSQGQKIIEFYFNSTGKIQVSKQRGVEVPQTTCKFGTQASATQELLNLFQTEESPFSSPKPTAMLCDFIERFTKDDDIVLDFFSGSGTTAHAVFNSNCKNGMKRKFILVQLQEDLDESLRHAQKDAVNTLKAGIKYLDNVNKPHKITEIAKQRIRLAGKKIVEETGKKDLDIGFRVLKLDESNMKDVYFTPEEYKQTDLVDMVSNIKEGRTAEDLLYACMLEWGLELSLPHKVQKIADFDVHIVNNGDLVACFADKISEEAIKQIAEMKPLRAVFRDSSFATDAARVNVGEIFKLKSPNTTIKVL